MRGLLALSLLLLMTSFANSGDWPQVLGPNRDSQAVGEAIEPWKEPPAVRWQFNCGSGYAGPAVAGDNVFLWHRRGNREVLDCLRKNDGSIRWSVDFPATYTGGVDPDMGPRCVPVVSGDRVIVYGAGGHLHAVSINDGKVLWSRDLQADFGAQEGYFGSGSTPLVVGEILIVEAGSRNGAGIIGLSLADGTERWRNLDSEASYASPVTIKLDGQTWVAAPLRLSTYVIDPSTGKVRSEFKFGRRGPSVVAATPLVDGSQLFVTAAYGDGCRKMELSGLEPKNLWTDEQVISSQYVSPVRVGDFLYAITGREDYSDAALNCVDWNNGKQRWIESDFGTAHLIAINERILAVRISGQVDLFAADPQSFQPLAATKLPEGTYRALPALSDGLLFVRRTQGSTRGQLVALDLSSKN